MQDTHGLQEGAFKYAHYEPVGVPSGWECIIAFWVHPHRCMGFAPGKSEFTCASACMLPGGWSCVPDCRAMDPHSFDFREAAA